MFEIKEIRLQGANDRIQCYHNGEFMYTFFAENICKKPKFLTDATVV